MTTATTYDRAAIMTKAWAEAREEVARKSSPFLGGARVSVREVFAYHLRKAWDAARLRVRIAREEAAKIEALIALGSEALQRAITVMENTDHLGHEGRAELRLYERAFAILARREVVAQIEERRALIASSAGRICAVTFTKADGTLRRMKVQPAKLKLHVKGDKASPAGRKASATRAARHPHLMPVWDVEAQAPRSVNLATLQSATISGETHQFRQLLIA